MALPLTIRLAPVVVTVVGVTAAAASLYLADKAWNMMHSDSSSETAATPASNAEVKPNLVEPDRAEHILNGDKTGGGHAPGANKPDKSEFPAGWSNERILGEISDVATDPSSSTRTGRGGRQISEGTRDGVDIRTVQEPDGKIVSGFPTNLPRNPPAGGGTP